MERALAAMEARHAAWEQEKDEAKRWEQQRFVRRAEAFVRSWNQFVEDYNRGIVDVRKVRRVSETFRKLEQAGGWAKLRRPAAR